MKATNRNPIALALFIFGLAVLLHGSAARASAQPEAARMMQLMFRDEGKAKAKAQPAATGQAVNFDVACDCRTFAYTRGIDFTQTLPGDGFSVRGKIFPAGTLPTGAATNDPNDPGSIGSWFCLGPIARGFAEILGGAPTPWFFYTQYHLFDDGNGLVSTGPAPAPPVAAVTGGMNGYSGASGDVDVTEVGTNVTGCPNLRFTFNLRKQAPK